MIRPIPLNLLIHEVVYEEYEGNPDGLGESYKAPVTLTNVRVDAVINRSQGTSSRTTDKSDDQYTLFYDVFHSKPAVTITKGSKVTFNGIPLTVSKPNPVYAFSLHHYEAGLN